LAFYFCKLKKKWGVAFSVLHLKMYFLQMIYHVPPETKTLSEFTAKQFIIVLWPCKFWRKFPSGNFHILILSGEALANVKLPEKKVCINCNKIKSYFVFICHLCYHYFHNYAPDSSKFPLRVWRNCAVNQTQCANKMVRKLYI